MKVNDRIHALAALTSERKPPHTHWIRMSGEPQSRYERSVEKKNPCPCRESKFDRPTRSLVTVLTELSQFPAQHRTLIMFPYIR